MARARVNAARLPGIDLPPEVKQRLAGMTARHDFNKFWDGMCRRPGSGRPPLTPEQRAKRPPSVHPLFMTHPPLEKRLEQLADRAFDRAEARAGVVVTGALARRAQRGAERVGEQDGRPAGWPGR